MSNDLSATAATVLRHLLADGQAELPGLGTLSLRTRPARPALDPITGQRLHIPERRVLAFVTDPEPDPRLALTVEEEDG